MEKYEKIRVIGRGAYGTVYLCYRISDRKLLIIKQIPVEQMTKDERQSALNEVKVLSMLHHPNIIHYIENFLEDKALMIVMEYAQGGTLFEYLQQRNGKILHEEVIMKFFVQMLLSLQHVHSKLVLHRDLKTQNILMDKRRETIKLGDFGISKVLSSKSKAYTVVGTPCYISPELCEGKAYNQKSDIWALGCVLFELATLKRAFEAENLPALILKIMRGTIDPIDHSYSSELKTLISKMLDLSPHKRPSINEALALPICLNALMTIYTELGAVSCRKQIPKAITDLSNAPARGRLSRSTSDKKENSGGMMTARPCVCTVFAWGGGLEHPTALALPCNDCEVTFIALGRTHKAGVTKNGRLFVWESPLAMSIEDEKLNFVPRFLEGQSAISVAKVACGDLFIACLTDRGILMTFGSGTSGCLGHGNNRDAQKAKIVESLLGYEIVEIACGSSHLLAVTNENELFSWGRGDNGRLGTGDRESKSTPHEIQLTDGQQAAKVICGLDCSMVITTDNRLMCAGSNRLNKLAMNRDQERIDEVLTFTPVNFGPLNEMAITDAAIGTSHSIVLNANKEVYTFGSNQFAQLGHDCIETPGRVLLPDASDVGAKFIMVACGDTYSIAITDDYDVYTWGKGSNGRLGRPGRNGPSSNSGQPSAVTLAALYQPYTVESLTSSHGSTLIITKPLNANNFRR